MLKLRYLSKETTVTNDNDHSTPTPPTAPERTKAVKLTAGVKLTPAAYDALNRYRLNKQAREGKNITWSNLVMGMVEELRARGERKEEKP